MSHGDEVLEEDDDDEIEALDNEGVGDEVEDRDEVSVFCLWILCFWIYPEEKMKKYQGDAWRVQR